MRIWLKALAVVRLGAALRAAAPTGAVPFHAALLAAVLGVVVPCPAKSQPLCTEAVDAWAAACVNVSGARVTPQFCDGETMIVRAAVAAFGEFGFELRPSADGSFRDAGGVGISPLGSVEWETAPAGLPEALDALEACVRAQTPYGFGPVASDREAPPGADTATSGEAPGSPPRAQLLTTRSPRPAPPANPWRLVLAFMLAAWVTRARWTEVGSPRRAPFVLAGLAVLTFIGRRALLPDAFFHQNGQGPMWVEFARCTASDYGPGYRELYGWAAHLAGVRPELGVFLLTGALMSLVAPLVWLLARGVGADVRIAFALAGLAAVDPSFARVSGSETYYASLALLPLAAAAILVWGARTPGMKPQGWRDPTFLAAVGAAGCLVAQAARIHPLGWLPCALVPTAALLAPGPFSVRARQACAAAVGIGVITALFALPAMLATLDGPLGSAWADPGAESGGFPRVPMLPLGLVLGLALAFARPRSRGLLAAVLLACAGLALLVTERLHPWTPQLAQAHYRLYTAGFVAAGAALLATFPRGRAQSTTLAAALVAVGLTWFVAGAPSWTRLPTDALEHQLALEWRDSLPADGAIVYVQRAGSWVFEVPTAQCVGAHPLRAGIVAEDVEAGGAPDVTTLMRPTFFYEGAMCSVPEAAATCDALLGQFASEVIVEAELPALGSLSFLHYPFETVVVRLHRVLGPVEVDRGESAR